MKRVTQKNSARSALSDNVDFDDLFDGETYLLNSQDGDFNCAPSTAATLIRDEFRRRYGHLTVRADGADVTVTVTRGEHWRKR